MSKKFLQTLAIGGLVAYSAFGCNAPANAETWLDCVTNVDHSHEKCLELCKNDLKCLKTCGSNFCANFKSCDTRCSKFKECKTKLSVGELTE